MMAWLLRAASSELRDIEEAMPAGVVVRAARWLPVLAGRLSGMRDPAAAASRAGARAAMAALPGDVSSKIRFQSSSVRLRGQSVRSRGPRG